jgi:hypothetical protein
MKEEFLLKAASDSAKENLEEEKVEQEAHAT